MIRGEPRQSGAGLHHRWPSPRGYRATTPDDHVAPGDHVAGTVTRVRTVIRGVGKTCIAAGVLILLFVAYQLWGTGIAEARSQRALKRQFAALPRVVSPTTTSTSVAGPPVAPRYEIYS